MICPRKSLRVSAPIPEVHSGGNSGPLAIVRFRRYIPELCPDPGIRGVSP